MIGMGVGGDEDVDIGNPQASEFRDYPGSCVGVAGVDQHGEIVARDQFGIPLADIDEIYLQGPGILCVIRRYRGMCPETADGTPCTGTEQDDQEYGKTKNYSRSRHNFFRLLR
jgi:hypothetical protein